MKRVEEDGKMTVTYERAEIVKRELMREHLHVREFNIIHLFFRNLVVTKQLCING